MKPVDDFSIKTSRKWRQLLVSSSLVNTIVFINIKRMLSRNGYPNNFWTVAFSNS